MKWRICLSVGKMDDAFEKMYEKLSEIAIVDVKDLGKHNLSGYDIYIGKKLSLQMLETADNLKAIFAYKTGVDDFPLKEIYKRNIVLMNSHIDADYIAEYAFGLATSLVNRITEFDKKLRKGIWYDTENPYWRSFFEMKVGIVGYGHIGKEIHRLLQRNNMDVYTIDRGHKYENISAVNSLEDLCDICDILILSLPKTEKTNKIINSDILKRLKNKYIVNVGRSNCIDQKALYEALKNREIGGVANDTWDHKPKNITQKLNPSGYDFCGLDNIVLSPHQAMRVANGHKRYVEDTTDKVINYILQGKTKDVVDLVRGY
ncbi:MAG: hypothetical protein IJC89_01600 [Clostridia bacterium]|nr:hypothetical protein [Clostridia bacterium]